MNKALRNCGGVLVLLTLLTAGFSFASDDDVTGGNLRGVNHTQEGITNFSVNGYSGFVGGDSCCILLPNTWRSGLKAQVEWVSDPNPREKIKRKTRGYGFDEQALAKHEASYKNNSAIVDIPKYGEKRCGLTVHFLPCGKVKTTTSCWAYGNPNYPIKEPLNMPEPKTCPR